MPITFAGVPAAIFRLWWPYAGASDEVVVVLNYNSTSNRRFVWLPAGQGDLMGRISPGDKPPAIGDGTGHGAYFWDQEATLLYVKMTGGRNLEVRTEPAIMVSDHIND